jgi:hypothetical protein
MPNGGCGSLDALLRVALWDALPCGSLDALIRVALWDAPPPNGRQIVTTSGTVRSYLTLLQHAVLL